MKKSVISTLIGAVFAATSFASLADDASGPSFDYVNLSYTEVELGYESDTYSGYRAQFVKSFNDVLFVRTGHERFGRGEFNTEEFEFSLGARHALDNNASLYAGVGFVNAHQSEARSYLGYNVFSGVAIRASQDLELHAELNRVHTYSETEVRSEFGARYYLSPRLSVNGSYGFSNKDREQIRVGVSFHF